MIASRRAMTRPTTGWRWGLLLALLLGATCVSGAAVESPSYQVGPGDVLQIALYAGGEKQEEFTATVSALSTITSPLLGEIAVGGLTTHEIARKLTELLARDYFVDPQVLVSVKEYGGQVYVMGAVRTPGAYGYQQGLTALRACLLAGGFTDFASLKRVRLTRVVGGRPKSSTVDLDRVSKGKAEDPLLMKGDRLDVPRRRF